MDLLSVCIISVICIYILMLKARISKIKEDNEKIKKRNYIEYTELSLKMNSEFKKEILNCYVQIDEFQKEICYLLDYKIRFNRLMDELKIKGSNDVLKEALELLKYKQKNINEMYQVWKERIVTERENQERELIENIDKHSLYKQNEFRDRVYKVIMEINNIQEDVNRLLSKNNREGIEITRDKFDNLELAEDLIKKNQKKLNDSYLLLIEKVGIAKKILTTQIREFPFVATVLSDYETVKEKAAIYYLQNKRRPAYSAAATVAEIRRERKKDFEQLYAYKWELSYLHSLFPWIEEIETDIVRPVDFYREVPSSNEDHVLNWVSPEEYNRLNTKERNQLALDRYIKSTKSKWVIGRDYERYIGYLYEKKGYKVKYFGIEEGLEDLGRDLICFRGNDIHIVQCKCWSEKKEIHEKHINQLFGTTVMYYLSEINAHGNLSEFYNYIKEGRIIPVFVTTTKFSNTARKFANSLNVLLMTVPLEDYPMIKCNINRNTGERIYHLPFDQQYDKCIINPAEGEFYAKTVKEAEENGFRRAMRWRGN